MIAGVIALVLLPVLMFGLAWALAAVRQWAGATALPHARGIVGSARLHRVSPGVTGT